MEQITEHIVQILSNGDWSWFFFFFFLRVEFCVKGKAGDTSEVSINITVLGSTSAVTRTPSFSVRPLKISQSRRRQVFPWQRWKHSEKAHRLIDESFPVSWSRRYHLCSAPFRRLTKSTIVFFHAIVTKVCIRPVLAQPYTYSDNIMTF